MKDEERGDLIQGRSSWFSRVLASSALQQVGGFQQRVYTTTYFDGSSELKAIREQYSMRHTAFTLSECSIPTLGLTSASAFAQLDLRDQQTLESEGNP